MPTTVLIIDESFMMRALIKDILTSSPDVRIVGEAENGPQGLSTARSLEPDVVVLDLDQAGDWDGVVQALSKLGVARVVAVTARPIPAGAGSRAAPRSLQVVRKPTATATWDRETKSRHELAQAVRRPEKASRPPSVLAN